MSYISVSSHTSESFPSVRLHGVVETSPTDVKKPDNSAQIQPANIFPSTPANLKIW